MRGYGRGAFALALLVAAGAHASEICDLEPSREGVVARVIDAETVALEDGEIVRLIGALAPAAPTW